MNKARMETFSDGVFAIVLTLLVLDLRVPELVNSLSSPELGSKLALLWPVFGSFLLSFLVISTFWITHHFLFNVFVGEVDRNINLLNLLYLLFLVLIPFSANLFGEYPDNQLAAIIYGVNILADVFIIRVMIAYARTHSQIGHEVPSRILKQANIRATLTVVFYMIGVACTFFYIPASVFFYIFPLVFNILPGTLTFFEKLFNFEIT